MTVLWLVIAVFAAWRITSLIAGERGPFAVGVRFRKLFGVQHDPDGSPNRYEGEVLLNPVTRWAWVDDLLHEVAIGMTCTWCCSVWVSSVLTLLLRPLVPEIIFDPTSYVLVALAMSAGVIALDQKVY